MNTDSRGAGRGRAGAGAAMSRGPAPEERPGSRPRRRPNGFRCSPGTPSGRKTRFGAVLAGPLAAKRVSVQPTPHRPRRALGLPAYFVVKTTERAIWPRRFDTRTAKTGNPGPDRPQSLHRNPPGGQEGRDCCTETRLSAKWDAITAPKLVRSPSGPPRLRPGSPGCQSQAPRNSFGGTGRAGTQGARGHRARGNVRRLVLPTERVARNGAVGDEPVLQTFEQALGFGGAVDSVAAEAVLRGDDTRVFQAQERFVGG